MLKNRSPIILSHYVFQSVAKTIYRASGRATLDAYGVSMGADNVV